MKKITTLAFVFALMTVSFVNAHDKDPKSPVGMSVITYKNIVKVFYRGEHAGKVKVTIYNANGRTVYNETMKNIGDFMRPYNFSFLPSGDYTIEVSDDMGKRTETVKFFSSDETNVAQLSR